MRSITALPVVILAARSVAMVTNHQLLMVRWIGRAWTQALAALLTTPLFLAEKVLSRALLVAFQALVTPS